MSIKAHEQPYSPTSSSGQYFEQTEYHQHQHNTHHQLADVVVQEEDCHKEEEDCEKRITLNMQTEIKELKRALSDKENQLMECLQENDRQVELEDSIIAWQDKYERLYESHKRVQKVNQNLEDKLLKLVERGESKNAQLTSDVATLSVRLAQANYNISLLQREIERYKTDMGLAIQLLQCKPDGVVAHKITTHLPIDLQNKLRSTYMRLDSTSHSDSEGSTHSAGIVTNNAYTPIPFRSDSPGSNAITPQPTTASSKRTNDQQITISPSVMVKFLEDELKTSHTRHCESCKCPNRDMTVVADIQKTYTIATQTIQTDSNLCIRCSNDLNSPSHVNSPFAMKLVKSSDSVISETKSSVSDSTQNEKLFSPAKKDDLTINPILSHHRLCERAASNNVDFMPMIVSPKISHISSSSSNASKTGVVPKNLCSPNNASLLERKLDVIQNDSYESHENMTKISGKFNETDVDLLLSTDPMINDSVTNDTDNDELLCNEKTYLLDKTEIASPVYRKSNNLASRNMILRTPELNRNNNKNSTTSPAGPSSCSTAGKNSSESYAIHDTDKITNKSDSLRGAGNGSTNSLWSRTSSRDGFKMFENFNRNLIKTIKAENPKMKGPRICALRIQTGSNNILIDDGLEDNMDVISPVVYTRRPRLLDEELDDEKDVTLAYDCKISMVMSDVQKKPIIVNEKTTGDMKFNDSDIVLPLYDKSSMNINKKNTEQNLNDSKPQSSAASVQPQTPIPNSYSFSRTTTSTSEIDLKRQQLSRVAEWVQNNSKINDVETNFPIKDTNEGDLINLIDTGFSTTENKHLIGNRTSLLTNPSSTDSLNPNNMNNNSENAITENTKPHKSLMDSLRNNITTDTKPKSEIAQTSDNLSNINSNNNNNKNSINLYKYFKLYSSQQSDYEDDEDLQYENGNDDDFCSNSDVGSTGLSEKNLDDENQIDLAQMEYNVKQFLLKQNEWSIHNKMTAPGGARLASSSTETTTKVKPHRTETNL